MSNPRGVASARAQIVTESVDEGMITRTEGNDSIEVVVFSPEHKARVDHGAKSSMIIETANVRLTLSGHNARTLYRVLRRHFGDTVEPVRSTKRKV